MDGGEKAGLAVVDPSLARLSSMYSARTAASAMHAISFSNSRSTAAERSSITPP
jgi:hypothetical protein